MFVFHLFRIRIMKNIGIVFVRMGQYNDAITAYEHIMSDKPDVESGSFLYLKISLLKLGPNSSIC